MKSWLKISLLLSVFGFLRETKPSGPFITDFLTDFKNVTLDEVLRDVYPIATYSYMGQAIVAFLITDFLRYKPLILLSGVTGIIVWSLFLGAQGLFGLQLAEVFYGTYLATEVAYYTYMYAKVDREHYDRVTAHNRSATFWGRFIGGVSGQALVLLGWMNYKELNYLTLGTQVLATIWAFWLPGVKNSIYFHRKKEEVVENGEKLNISPKKEENAFQLLWSHFKMSYSDIEVIQWSLWYAIGNCGFVQITTYIQVLWNTIDDSQDVIWNGAVEAIVTLLSAIVTLFAEKIQNILLSNSSSLWTLIILTALEGFALILGTKTTSLYVSYLGYTLFCTLFAFTITICSSGLAKRLADDTFGLIFGINTFVALIMQSALTIVVVSGSVLQLGVIEQFLVYAGFYFAFAGLYGLNVIYDLIKRRN